MYSITIYSDDGALGGNVEYCGGPYASISYVGRIWDVRHRTPDGRGAKLVESKSFGNGVLAENWMLDKLECPMFTLLANN